MELYILLGFIGTYIASIAFQHAVNHRRREDCMKNGHTWGSELSFINKRVETRCTHCRAKP